MGVARCLGIVCAVAMGIGAFTATQLVMAKDANIQTYQRLGTGKWETGAQIPLHTEPRHLKMEKMVDSTQIGSTNIPFLNIPWGGHDLFLAKPFSSRRFTDHMVTGMILGTVCPEFLLEGSIVSRATLQKSRRRVFMPMSPCWVLHSLAFSHSNLVKPEHEKTSGPQRPNHQHCPPLPTIAHHCHYPSIGLLV